MVSMLRNPSLWKQLAYWPPQTRSRRDDAIRGHETSASAGFGPGAANRAAGGAANNATWLRAWSGLCLTALRLRRLGVRGAVYLRAALRGPARVVHLSATSVFPSL